MNKTLKFAHHLVQAVLTPDRGTTVRLFDDKDLSAGDVIDFLDAETGKHFATARVTDIQEAAFGEDAKRVHDPESAYKMYESYYKRPISPETPMKYIHYEFIQKFP